MRSKYLQAAALSIGIALLASCTAEDRRRTEDKTASTADRAEKKVDDATLTTSVKSKLAADVRLGTLTSINVDSNGGTVTLSGNVKTSQEKELAETVARTVDGVSTVVNRLQVKP